MGFGDVGIIIIPTYPRTSIFFEIPEGVKSIHEHYYEDHDQLLHI